MKQETGLQSRYSARVLLAEDSVVNQKIAMHTLSVLGCKVDVVFNGKEAVEAFFRNQYDLIFMDCMMPEMDGFEATMMIRSSESQFEGTREGTRVPVIAMTARISEENREKCKEAGMDDYINKPFGTEELGNILNRWLPCAVNSAPLEGKIIDTIRSVKKNGKSELLNEVLRSYIDSTPELLKKLQDAVAGNDAETMHETAHPFKSASGNMGALHLAELCREMESIGQAGELEKAGDVLSSIEKEYEKVINAMNAELEKSPS